VGEAHLVCIAVHWLMHPGPPSVPGTTIVPSGMVEPESGGAASGAVPSAVASSVLDPFASVPEPFTSNDEATPASTSASAYG
jgi:hypothetical protein